MRSSVDLLAGLCVSVHIHLKVRRTVFGGAHLLHSIDCIFLLVFVVICVGCLMLGLFFATLFCGVCFLLRGDVIGGDCCCCFFIGCLFFVCFLV